MKSIILLASILSFNLHAAIVKKAELDSTGKNILLSVVYGGGCGPHEFKLTVGECLESYPVQCRVTLQHTTNDYCEALISETLKFSLEEVGLDKEYYNHARLSIFGDRKSWVPLELN